MRLTIPQARELGYSVMRGAYYGTTDDRADRWYIDTLTGPVDHRGPGYDTRRAALDALAEMLRERGVEVRP